MSPAFVLLSLPVFLFSIVVHECAHGLAALSHGDPTARNAGRITLNPLPHIDLFGSIIVPLMFLLAQGFKPTVLIGWAKPVPINPFNFRAGRRSEIEVSLSGPLSNIGLAFVFALMFRLLPPWQTSGDILIAVRYMLLYGMQINCLLAVFNLIPVPPLDGSHVLAAVLPPGPAYYYRRVANYGMWILIVVLMFPPLRRLVLDVPVGLLRGFFEMVAGSYYTM
jgi:Zn-dependent protease